MPAPDELAVIVCTRNRPEMLRAALASIVALSDPAIEVLVVDSASATAETADVAASAGVRYVRSDVKGLSIARNAGLSATERSLVVYTDDDCLAVEGWLDPVLAAFADPAVGAVTGHMSDGDDQEPPQLSRFTTPLSGVDAGHGAIMAFRRDLILTLGGFDDVLGAGRPLAGAEDLDMFVRVLAAGYAIVLDPAARIRHVNTREDRAYTQLLYGYGLGLGALAAKWMRLRPTLGVAITVTFVKRNLARIRRSRGDERRAPAERAMLAGIRRGFAAGLRMRLVGQTYHDPHPPAPTVLVRQPAEPVALTVVGIDAATTSPPDDVLDDGALSTTRGGFDDS